MLHRWIDIVNPKRSRAGASKPSDQAEARVVIGADVADQREGTDEGASLFMQTEDGTLKAVKLKTRSGASGVTSPGYQHLYSKALARYIIDQEKKGNKFFIQQPGGSIKRFSVVRNPIEPFSNRHGIVAEQA